MRYGLFIGLLLGVLLLFNENLGLFFPALTETQLISKKNHHQAKVIPIQLDEAVALRSPSQVETWVIDADKIQLNIRAPSHWRIVQIRNVTNGYTATVFGRAPDFITDYVPINPGQNQIELEWDVLTEKKPKNNTPMKKSLWVVAQ